MDPKWHMWQVDLDLHGMQELNDFDWTGMCELLSDRRACFLCVGETYLLAECSVLKFGVIGLVCDAC